MGAGTPSGSARSQEREVWVHQEAMASRSELSSRGSHSLPLRSPKYSFPLRSMDKRSAEAAGRAAPSCQAGSVIWVPCSPHQRALLARHSAPERSQEGVLDQQSVAQIPPPGAVSCPPPLVGGEEPRGMASSRGPHLSLPAPRSATRRTSRCLLDLTHLLERQCLMPHPEFH